MNEILQPIKINWSGGYNFTRSYKENIDEIRE